MPPGGHCSAYTSWWWDSANTATATLLVLLLDREYGPDGADEALTKLPSSNVPLKPKLCVLLPYQRSTDSYRPTPIAKHR